jgi:isochorismate pyruvate lyase
MTPQPPSPNPLGLAEPHSLAGVRSAVDAIDRELALALARRAFYVREAVRFKQDLDGKDIEERRQAIIAGAIALAEPLGAPAEVVSAVFTTMIARFRDLQGEVCRRQGA